ncbi:hypothetical protein SAMN04488109_2521 [Chryseolinea serpens]|uniref:Chlor_Arch_YYY domain-containing protein n=1 Tax=Chryseolinea serpens TaxID=947013 RepID=A0A1M5NUE9_9BACT|nr:hypothetical protein [Chryseolinea serpens]SHG93152.1 hypothetical protein SAMN04488109_2521 [Chryseolinea serpens]
MYLTFLLQFVFVLLFFGGTGALAIRLFNKNWFREFDFLTLFASVLVGAILAATLTAVFFTRGKTILTAFIPLGIALGFLHRSTHQQTEAPLRQKKNIRTTTLLAALTTLFIFSLCYWQSVTTSSVLPFVLPHYDYILYNNISYFFSVTGQENIFHINNLYDASYHGAKPHHYLDSWINVLTSTAFGRLDVVNYYLCILPLVYSLIVFGLLALCEIKDLPTVTGFGLAFSLLFFGGVLYPWVDLFPLFANADNFALTAVHGHPKLTFYYIFILAAVVFLYKNNTLSATLALLCLPVMSITALPAIAGGLVLFLLINLKGKWIPPVVSKKILLSTVLTGLFIGLFYVLFDHAQVNMEGTHVGDVKALFVEDLLNINSLRTRINIIGGTVIQLSALYLPFLALLLLFKSDFVSMLRKRELGIFATLAVAICAAGLGGWVLFQRLVNGMQVFNNPAIPTINCVCFVVIIEMASQLQPEPKPKKFRMAAGMFLFLLVIGAHLYSFLSEKNQMKNYDHFGKEYLQAIKSFVASSSSQGIAAGVSLKGPDEYATVFSKYTVYYTLGDYLPFFANGFVPISISDFEIKLSTANSIDAIRDLNAVKLGLFYRFVQAQKEKGTFHTVEQSQLDFIEKYRVRYAIVSAKATIPPFLQARTQQQFTDTVSGERFLILK